MTGDKEQQRTFHQASRALRGIRRLLVELAYPGKGRRPIEWALLIRVVHLHLTGLLIAEFGHAGAIELTVDALNHHRPADSPVTLQWHGAAIDAVERPSVH